MSHTLLWILDENHNPVPLSSSESNRWSYFMTDDNKRVGYDVEDRISISTIFLGIDHNYLTENDPILFESAVFRNKIVPLEQRRYRTWAQAQAGHRELCAVWIGIGKTILGLHKDPQRLLFWGTGYAQEKE